MSPPMNDAIKQMAEQECEELGDYGHCGGCFVCRAWDALADNEDDELKAATACPDIAEVGRLRAENAKLTKVLQKIIDSPFEGADWQHMQKAARGALDTTE